MHHERQKLTCTGLPTRSRLHSRHIGRRHGTHGTPPRPTTNTPRESLGRVPRARRPSLLHEPPDPHALDQSHLLLHPHPRHHPLPRLAIQLHNRLQTPLLHPLHNEPVFLPISGNNNQSRPSPLRSPQTHNGNLQPDSLYNLHPLALHAAPPPLRPSIQRAQRQRGKILRLRGYSPRRRRGILSLDSKPLLQSVRRNAQFAFRVFVAGWCHCHDHPFGTEARCINVYWWSEET